MTYRLARRLLIPGMVVLSGCGGGSGSSGTEPPTFDPGPLSGVISIEAGSRVDSDTADDSLLGAAQTNNDLQNAQILPSSGTTGGYLSATSGTYSTDGEFQFQYVVDTQDFYRISLSEGDRVALQLFQSDGMVPPAARMQINNSRGDIVFDSGLSTGSLTPITVIISEAQAASGPHVVRLSTASGGPFRYVFTVTPQGSATVMNTAYAEPDIRLDEAVITFRDPAMAEISASGVASALQVANARALGGGAFRLRRGLVPDVRGLSVEQEAYYRQDTLAWVAALGRQPDIEVAEPNYLYHSQSITPDNNKLYPLQWNLPLINLPVAWQAAPSGGQGVGVAVLDTGLFSETPNTFGEWHSDLNSNVVAFVGARPILDYVSGSLDIDNQPGRDTNPADPGDGKAQSSNFHGTHVAGIATAVDNELGIIGVAPKSTLWPVRVLGRDGAGALDDLVAAVNWAATQNGIDVINLSLGGVGPSSTLSAAIDAAYDRGKLVVAAAGNQGTDELTFPAAFERVVGVGAVDGAKVRASYSNFGGSVDLVAPGGDASRDANQDDNADLIISAWGRDEGADFRESFAGLQGTSMAAPHVAGVFALMKGVNSSIDAPQFFALLASGALTEPVGNRTEYGEGLIDALKAVDAALNGDIPEVLGASPTALQFSSALVSKALEFNRFPANASITVTSVTLDAGWVQLGPDLVVGSPPPDSVNITVDASGLEEGETLTAALKIEYNTSETAGKSLDVPISLRVGNALDDRNAGRHYVLLVSTDESRKTIEEVVVTAEDGKYRFAFGDVEPGEYFLVAGTDMDNNGLICENGEACAEYPVNGLPEKIVIGQQGSVSVSMSTSFRRPTISSMGLPRYGFEGYRLKSRSSNSDEPVRRLESAR